MKNIAVVGFTKNSKEYSQDIIKTLEQYQYDCVLFQSNKNAREVEMITALRETKQWVEEYWKIVDAFVFIGGTDIAVRMFSTFIEDKMKDPAVLVMDEEFKYVIPLLGNHLGCGNALADKLAKWVNGTSVITTPKEISEKFTIEKFAELNEMEIGSRDQGRTISSAILDGQHIGFYCEYEIVGNIPEELTWCEEKKQLEGFMQQIAIRNEYVVGMGLKQNVPYDNVKELFLAQLEELEIDLVQVKGIATIASKKEELALLELSRKYKIPILSYTESELRDVHLVQSSDPSAKHEANISERAAFKGSDCGELVREKVVGDGVTFVAAKKIKKIYFE